MPGPWAAVLAVLPVALLPAVCFAVVSFAVFVWVVFGLFFFCPSPIALLKEIPTKQRGSWWCRVFSK